MVSHVFALENEFSKFPNLLSTLPGGLAQDRKQYLEQSMRQWISRRIVRSGFEVTLNRNDRLRVIFFFATKTLQSFIPNDPGRCIKF